MKYRLTLILAGVVVAGSAFAQHTYMNDDGMAEQAIGLSAGGEFTWLNAFQVNGLNSQINSVLVSWTDTSGMVGGEAFNVHVWSDPNQDGSPLDAVLLDSVATTIDAGAITAGATVFQSVALSELLAGGAGTWFFVGASITHAAGTFPAALDQTAPTGNAWINLGGPGDLSGAATIASFGLPGDWMVRAEATAVPEPATFIAIGIGLAGLALARRRK